MNAPPGLLPSLHRLRAGFSRGERFVFDFSRLGCDRLNLVVIAIVAFVANYLQCRYFGLYEDDYIWIMTLNPMGWKSGDLVNALREVWSQWIVYQGRPLGFSIGAILAYVGGKLPSLTWSYGIGWVIWSVNGALVYRVSRQRLSPLASLAAGLCFVTFCPDVSKAILMHRLIHVSTTLVLVALLLYQRRHYPLSYFVAACALFTYESPVFAFLLAPLTVGWAEDRRQRIARMLSHLCAFLLLAAAALTARNLSGDAGRAGLVTGGGIVLLPKVIEACLLGLWTTARASFWVGPRTGFSGFDWSRCLTAMLVVPLFMVAARRSRPGIPPGPHPPGWAGLRFLAGCLAVTAASYCLNFRPEYFPPTRIVGRLSGVHVPAGIPWALAMGALVDWLLSRREVPRGAVIPALGAYLFLVVQYGLFVQENQYAKSWRQQQQFWTEMVRISGSLHDGDRIIVDVQGGPRAYGFIAEGGVRDKYFVALSRFVKFPAGWRQVPGIFGFDRSTRSDWTSAGLRVHTPYWNAPTVWPVLNRNFYFFKYRDQVLIPVDGPVRILGHDLQAKKLDVSAPPRPVTGLFRKIFMQM